MAIPIEQLEHVRKALDESARPLFLFDDDPDGLSSFLLLYRYKGDGKGVIVKNSPELKQDHFIVAINEYHADLVLILDKPLVSQDFLDQIKVPVYWIDHHAPLARSKVTYLNPRLEDDKDNRPTSYWAWQIVKASRPQDLWIAGVGVVSDWFIPDFRAELQEKYPDLLPDKIKRPEQALFATKIGILARVFAFNLKGSTKDMLASAKVLTRIKEPGEILHQTTSQGNFLFKKYMAVKKEYDSILHTIKPTKDKVLLYRYNVDNTAFTANLSNELLFKYPRKVILIARLHQGSYKCSLRGDARYSKPINAALEQSLVGIRGYGGGHPYACGASIEQDDFEKFLDQFRKAVSGKKEK